MGKKYYLDDQGLIRVLQKISSNINNNTASNINVSSSINPDTGEEIQQVQDPNKFATVGAVYNYVAQSKKKLTINQQSTVDDPEIGYNVQDNISEYNGNEETEIELNLVDIADIRNLFI